MIYRSTWSLMVAFTVGASMPTAADETAPLLQNRSIAYVLTEEHWAIYQTPDGKTECPNGLNDGPREEFKALFPADGAQRTYVDTAMARESEIWFPGTHSDQLPFHEAQGKISYGLNLDGKIGSNDFTSPKGEKGIDNQMFRALGCIAAYRGPDGFLYFFNNLFIQNENYNRVVIELTNVDSLVNDDDVTVTTYRGLDSLLTDASGQGYLPRGTQRLDLRWGQPFIQRFHGRIRNGVLETEPADLTVPAAADEQDLTVQVFRGLRWRLKLTPEDAQGLMAGYVDVDAFYLQSNESWSTHHHSYGANSASSMYRALRRLADGYPDPKTGQNTAISSAMLVKFKQVFINRALQQGTAQTTQANRKR
jgi:hypothetical protein